MTDKKKKQAEKRDELDLDPETVEDLEPTGEDTEAVRGGGLIEYPTHWCTYTCQCGPAHP